LVNAIIYPTAALSVGHRLRPSIKQSNSGDLQSPTFRFQAAILLYRMVGDRAVYFGRFFPEARY